MQGSAAKARISETPSDLITVPAYSRQKYLISKQPQICWKTSKKLNGPVTKYAGRALNPCTIEGDLDLAGRNALEKAKPSL